MFEISNLQGTTKLHNGKAMPYFGLGVFQMSNNGEVEKAVSAALENGYIHIDTASAYQNEEGVGKAIKNSGIKRENLFITSKLWNAHQGYESTLEAFQRSLDRLQTDYLDLYLIHWPVKNKYVETWKAFEKLYADGKVKAIGVSNFLQHHLQDVIDQGSIVPMVNQMEFHPYLVQQSLIDFCNQHQIQYEAWSPLMQGQALHVPLLNDIGKKYDKSPVQVILRWDLQKGIVTIPKSSNPERIKSNAQVFDFSLTDNEMEQISALDKNERIGPDPDNFNF